MVGFRGGVCVTKDQNANKEKNIYLKEHRKKRSVGIHPLESGVIDYFREGGLQRANLLYCTVVHLRDKRETKKNAIRNSLSACIHPLESGLIDYSSISGDTYKHTRSTGLYYELVPSIIPLSSFKAPLLILQVVQ